LEQRDRSCWWKGRKGEGYKREEGGGGRRREEGGGRRQREAGRTKGKRQEPRDKRQEARRGGRLIGTSDRCGRQFAALREKKCGGWHPDLTPYTEYR
jgi:hypothetical protein